MAVTINADTSNGLVMTPDTSGEIKLQTAGADIVSVTANGIDVTGGFTVDTNTLYVDATNNNVGIGTSSPDAKTDIVTDSNALSDINDSSNYTLDLSNKANDNGEAVGLSFGISSDTGVIGASIYHIREGSFSYGPLVFATKPNGGSITERMRIGSSGSVFINTTTSVPSGNGFAFDTATNGYSLFDIGHVSGATTVGSYVRFYYGGAQIGRIAGASASSVQYLTTSDYRLKENSVNITDGISRVKLLKPYRFNFITEPDNIVDGFYAHEVHSVVPEAVNGTKDAVDDEGNPEYQGIDQSKLVPLLTAALQEAITKIEDLETRIQALENA